MNELTAARLRSWAATYNNPVWFEGDPVSFPRAFAKALREGIPVQEAVRAATAIPVQGAKVTPRLEDVEIAALFSSHLAWGRRAMIIRDCGRLFDEMAWSPYDYVMSGQWRDEDKSLHRTIKWSEIARICRRLKDIYSAGGSLEELSPARMRCEVFGQKDDPAAANKKIHLMRRWMVRSDGKVDLGLWTNTDPADLIIPLDVHVHRMATELDLTTRKQKDYKTALEITRALDEVFPGDPCLGDYALFGYGVVNSGKGQTMSADA